MTKVRTEIPSSFILVKVRLSRHNFPIHQDILRVQSTSPSKGGRVSVQIEDIQGPGSSIRPKKRATSMGHDGIRHLRVEGEPVRRSRGIFILIERGTKAV